MTPLTQCAWEALQACLRLAACQIWGPLLLAENTHKSQGPILKRNPRKARGSAREQQQQVRTKDLVNVMGLQWCSSCRAHLHRSCPLYLC
jgi:hypothetical protein